MNERTKYHIYCPWFLVGLCLILASCSGLLEPDGASKDTGSVVISLPSSASAARAIFGEAEQAALLPQLSYTLELRGPRNQTKNETLEAGTTSIILDLAIGNWTMNVIARYGTFAAGENETASTGNGGISFIVEKGKRTSVPVQMDYTGAALIYDGATLRKIGTDAEYPANGVYWLAKDITVSDWVPLPAFTGTFVGFDHTITINSLSVTALRAAGTDNFLGLFSTLGATARVSYLNLALDWNYDTSTPFTSGVNQSIGGLAGKAASGSVITGCRVSGTLAFKANASVVTLGGLAGDLAGSVIESGGRSVHIKGISNGFDFLAGGIAGSLNGGSIKDSRVEEGTIETDNDNGSVYAGGLAGRSGFSGVIENSSSAVNVGFSSTVPPGTSTVLVFAGGLLGSNDSRAGDPFGGGIRSSHATGAVTVTNADQVWVGGLAGEFMGSGGNIDIEDSDATGNVTVSAIDGMFIVGGLIGQTTDCTIMSCYASGNVTADGTSGAAAWAGGLIGYSNNGYSSSSSVSIDSSYALGNVTVGDTVPPDNEIYAGGLIGRNYNSGAGSTIISSHAEGFVDIHGGGNILSGGLVGDIGDSKIEDCYTLGDVKAETSSGSDVYAGGVAGTIDGFTVPASITNCYARGEISASGGSSTTTAGGIAGYTGLSSAGSIIEYCAALNVRITASTGGTTTCNRIVGEATGSFILNNNFGLEAGTPTGMTISPTTPITNAHNDENGLDGVFTGFTDKTSSGIFHTVVPTGLGWDFTGVWEHTGELPTLRGL